MSLIIAILLVAALLISVELHYARKRRNARANSAARARARFNEVTDS